MEILTIRYSWQQIAAIFGCCFLAIASEQAFENGLGFIARTWSDPLFWGLMIFFQGLIALASWAIPTARLSQENISTHSYPFKIEWRNARRFKVSSFFGLIWLRIYGVKSRYPLWIPMPRNRIHSIYLFMQRTNGAETVLPAFADKWLNNALKDVGPHPTSSAHP